MSASATPTKATEMFRFLPKDQLDAIAKMAAVSGMTFEAVVAVRLCQEALRDYCPLGERGRAIGMLFAIENRRRTEGDAP